MFAAARQDIGPFSFFLLFIFYFFVIILDDGVCVIVFEFKLIVMIGYF